MYIERSKLKTNSDLRAMAREQLKGNWGISLLVCFLIALISGIPGIVPYVGFIGSLIIAGPFMLGMCIYFIKLARNDYPSLSSAFDGLKDLETHWHYIFLWLFLLSFGVCSL